MAVELQLAFTKLLLELALVLITRTWLPDLCGYLQLFKR
jgi:hypothetical protein